MVLVLEEFCARIAITSEGFWFSLSSLLFALYFLLWLFVLRFRRYGCCTKQSSGGLKVSSQEPKEDDCLLIERKSEFDEIQDLAIFSDLTNDDLASKDASGFSFTFKFPTYEEFVGSKIDQGKLVSLETSPPASSSNCEADSSKSFQGFVDESEVVNYSINEARVGTDCKSFAFNVAHSEQQSVLPEETARETRNEEEETEEGGASMETEESAVDEVRTHSERGDSSVNSKNGDGFNPVSRLIDSFADGFLSEGDFLGGICDLDEEDGELAEAMRKLEEADAMNSSFLSDRDFYDEKGNQDASDEKSGRKDHAASDLDETSKLESLWERQELIEQLKMELKKVRATGLPTISEESEPPKIMEDLKPWKMDEKLQQGDRAGELHGFYKSYRERMRKFDTLSYQKMYAIGLLQPKGRLRSTSSQKSLIPEIASLLSRRKPGKHEDDPTTKFIKELLCDLEAVCVGQMCLSWEILHWQYEKALDLWESDPRGSRRYNEVANEFQLFQVLLQRFVEDEAFQGPRVTNYVENRCVLRDLLQVPLLREDGSRNRKRKASGEGHELNITSDKLVEIMEESIRVFWRFVRADKDCSSPISKCRKGRAPVEFQDPADFVIYSQVLKNLQKKERKLRDLLKSETCILRKFNMCREDDDSDQVLYFFSQVDMRLVSRVLRMPRLTADQLVWCDGKLSRISFINRKIQVEPVFLLFPS